MPEPDLRNIAVAASRDVNHAPAILFDNIAGYPGKRTVVGVHGSWDNIALLLGQPKGTTIRDMFFDIAGRWGDASAQISRVSADRKSVVSGKRLSVLVYLGGRRIIKKQKTKKQHV